jgi:hypothetical protein
MADPSNDLRLKSEAHPERLLRSHDFSGPEDLFRLSLGFQPKGLS